MSDRYLDLRQGAAACVLDALNDFEAAEALGVGVQTVRLLVRDLCQHWGARNRVQLALMLAGVQA